MVNRFILVTFFSAITTFLFGQEFYDSLRSEASRTYNCSFDYYNVDSLNKVFFDSKNVRMLIDSNANYQVLFSETESWCSGPNCLDQFTSLDTLVIGEIIGDEDDLPQLNIRRKKYFHCSKTYKGVELIKNTEVNLKDTVFTNFPILKNNWDNYNREWTLFSNDKYLVFRFAVIYIGNTSYYREELIYFKKIE